MSMDSNNEIKEINIKMHTCCCFDDIIKIENLDLDNILIDEKPNDKILVYLISYINLIAKPLRIRFDKIDGFIRVYNEIRYLVLFGSEKYDSVYSRIRYLISVRSCITYVISHNYAKIKVDSYNFLPLEKTITFHIVIIRIKSVWNKDKNNHYYNIFLEKETDYLKKNYLKIT